MHVASLRVPLLTVLALLAAATAPAQPATPPPAVPGAGPPASRDLFEAIHVAVGPSARVLDPVAVVPAKCASTDACKDIDAILPRDLTLSGYFKVLDPKSFLGDPANETIAVTRFQDWFNVGARYVVKAEAAGRGGTVDLEFRLLDVNEKKAIFVKGQTARGVARTGVRRATHEFVNGVIEAVTGKRGIFGSDIVMSVKRGNWQRDIVSVELGGTGTHVLVSNGSSNNFPRWAPGGAVLYTSFLPGHPSLHVGGRRITNDSREYRGADFSPDGSRIAASVDMGGQSDLVIVDPKTGEILKNLTNSSWDEVQPTWAPDGSQVAFVSNRTGNPQIYAVPAGGGGERRLTMAGAYNTSPRFGRNGLVVFAGMDGFQSDIFTVDPSGTIARLTQDQGSNKDPSWSPDARYVVFLSNRDGGWKPFVMTEDGRYQYPLIDGAGAFATPDWGR
ncbi:MAG: PD40 domain-containing protein [Deltaproteobacteria bacterium]|nr:PD40 domain-containing protein [Deltaproteobacteria bacterium]